MKYKYQELSDALKENLLKNKETLYVYKGKNTSDAIRSLISYGSKSKKWWRQLRYNQLCAIDKARESLGLEKIHNVY